MMNRRLCRELWKIRFQKMLGLELQSVRDYESLFKQCAKKTGHEGVAGHLSKLIADEKRHAKLCQELLRIVQKQDP